jgi:LmbE family N-acetylglucosaminyl deacetylase
MEANVVIFSPHLDDAVFSCWHVLESERAVSVVNVFAGVPPPGTPLPRWDRITGASEPVSRVRERLDEDRLALGLADREPTNLPFVEAQYRDEKPTLDEVLPAIREHITGTEEVFVPAGIGEHPAHCLIREAGLILLGEGVAVSFYADIPYATEFGWPAWVSGIALEPFLTVDAAWSEALSSIEAAGCEPRVVALDDDAQQRKAAAMRTYRTQFAALEAGGQQRLTRPELIGFEVAWFRPVS